MRHPYLYSSVGLSSYYIMIPLVIKRLAYVMLATSMIIDVAGFLL